MPLTPEHNIYYPDSQSQFTPLESHFAAMATSVDDAMIQQGSDLEQQIQSLISRVNEPTPYFRGRTGTTSGTALSGTQPVRWDAEGTNGFTVNSQGFAVAQHAGLYFVQSSILAQSISPTTGRLNVQITRNGSNSGLAQTIFVDIIGLSGYQHGFVSDVLHLAVGDRLGVAVTGTPTRHISNWSRMTAHRVGV